MEQSSGTLIDVGNLRAVCDEVAGLLGLERLNTIIATFEPQKTKGLPEFLQHRAQAHPLAVEWQELSQAITRSERANALLLPDRSIFLLDQLIRLRSLKTVRGIDRLLARIENRDQYYSALFEIFVLSLYREMGAEIEIVPELSETGQRTPDFVVRCGDGDVYVECKSLEDRSRKEERIWEQIEGPIVKLMSARRRAWRVMITSTRGLSGSDIPTLVSLASNRISSGLLAPATSADGAVTIAFEPSPAWHVGGFETLERRAERVYVEADQFMGPSGLVYLHNLRVVESAPFHETDETRRILSSISGAHGQIPKGACGVVHVEIPHRNSDRILDVGDLAFQRTFGFLKQRTRINAVVLSARTQRPAIKEGDNPVLDYFVVVPNANPAAPFPEKFRIVGAEDGIPVIASKRLLADLRWWAQLIWLSVKSCKVFWPTIVSSARNLEGMLKSGQGTIALEFSITADSGHMAA